jgi:PHD/YefM family antitoxin component YafN of YafNO toxin-antitoxin module
MRRYTTAELVKHVDDVTHAAIEAPIAITVRRKPRLVMMSLERYEALRREHDPRRAFGPGELPLAESQAVVAALERSIAELKALQPQDQG